MPFLVDIPVEALILFFVSLVKFRSSCTLSFLNPSLHIQAVSLHSSQDICPCLQGLCISCLPLGLTTRSRLIHACLLPSFSDFLQPGIENSCTLWKASLKISQFGCAPLLLRVVSYGLLLTNSLCSISYLLIYSLTSHSSLMRTMVMLIFSNFLHPFRSVVVKKEVISLVCNKTPFPSSFVRMSIEDILSLDAQQPCLEAA